jgi:pimeloyl-ACP methyl ester carboxylesterase
MPYVKSQGVNIHYEVDGSGFPLLLQHGFADSMATWYERGYVDTLKKRYRLILIDARGHGLSDKPHGQGAYSLEHFTGDVLAVLDNLNIQKALYFGYSMGGWIGLGLGRDARERFSAMVLGGASPYALPPGGADWLLTALEQGVEGLLPIFDGYLTQAFKDRILANDADALTACRLKRLQIPSMDKRLPDFEVPCLLYAGDADPIFDAVRRTGVAIPNATFFSLPGAGHVQVMMESQSVLPRIVQFLEGKGAL